MKYLNQFEEYLRENTVFKVDEVTVKDHELPVGAELEASEELDLDSVAKKIEAHSSEFVGGEEVKRGVKLDPEKVTDQTTGANKDSKFVYNKAKGTFVLRRYK